MVIKYRETWKIQFTYFALIQTQKARASILPPKYDSKTNFFPKHQYLENVQVVFQFSPPPWAHSIYDDYVTHIAVVLLGNSRYGNHPSSWTDGLHAHQPAKGICTFHHDFHLKFQMSSFQYPQYIAGLWTDWKIHQTRRSRPIQRKIVPYFSIAYKFAQQISSKIHPSNHYSIRNLRYKVSSSRRMQITLIC